MILRFKILSLLVLFARITLGQDISDPQYRSLMTAMENGVNMMNQGNYIAADNYFQQVLEEVEVVPAELCFYFGKNSYHLEKYKQSIDWLTKYIELKGTKGQYFDQATEYLKLSESDYLTQRRTLDPSLRKESKTQPKKIDCEENPFVLCPVCNGSGVIIEQGSLGNAIYRTCPYSDEQGRMPCSNYTEYMKGNPVPINIQD